MEMGKKAKRNWQKAAKGIIAVWDGQQNVRRDVCCHMCKIAAGWALPKGENSMGAWSR